MIADVDTPAAPEIDEETAPSEDEALDLLWEDMEAYSIAESIPNDPRMTEIIEDAICKIIALGHKREHVLTYLEDNHAITLPKTA